jgi:hypothetical protein
VNLDYFSRLISRPDVVVVHKIANVLMRNIAASIILSSCAVCGVTLYWIFYDWLCAVFLLLVVLFLASSLVSIAATSDDRRWRAFSVSALVPFVGLLWTPKETFLEFVFNGASSPTMAVIALMFMILICGCVGLGTHYYLRTNHSG